MTDEPTSSSGSMEKADRSDGEAACTMPAESMTTHESTLWCSSSSGSELIDDPSAPAPGS